MAHNPLANRLSALRRRLLLVAGFRGGAWLLFTALSGILVAGLLDWQLHLPGLARAVLLVSTLAAAGAVAYRWLIQPLRARTDHLSLALRIEAEYPELNDGLASTVQFLEAPDGAGMASAALRQAAVRQALSQAEKCDFNRVIDDRGLHWAGLSLAGVALPGLLLLLFLPGIARTALARLADPFGAEQWPPQTRFVDQTEKFRVAREQPFEVRGNLAGVVPERAVVIVHFEGKSPAEYTYAVARQKDGQTGKLVARLEGNLVTKSFRYRVRANDTVTPWRQVAVLAPPRLVPLNGRPSPHTTLRYPAYTDLGTVHLPDGVATIKAVAGTRIFLRAAVDRPLSAVWIEYHPDQPREDLAAFLGPLGADRVLSSLSLHAAGRRVWGKVPARLETGGRIFSVDFVPPLSGTYALRLEDESGLETARLFAVDVPLDPPPLVEMERPSPSHDTLALLPRATITVQVRAEDRQFAVRSVYLEYHCGKDEPLGQLPLYDRRALGAGLPALLAALGGVPLPIAAPSWRLRPSQLHIERRLSLQLLTRADGSSLREGDVVVLRAAADDFDNIAVDKEPGRSHEIEIRIVGRPALEALLNQSQARVQQELLRLREQQRDALKRVEALEKQWRNTGQLRQEDLEKLIEAEQLQRQIRDRVGTRQEGLRAEIERIRQMLHDNHLPRSGAHERMEMVDRELERLAREELGAIEPLLTEARKENELAAQRPKPNRNRQGPLAEAVDHQDEVEKTLAELLARLEPWSTTREVKGEARALLEEQRRLAKQTERLGQTIRRGDKPADLKPEQLAELEKTADQQNRLGEHASQLLNKMERVAAEKVRAAAEKERLAQTKQQRAEEKKKEAEALPGNDPRRPALAEEAETLAGEAKQLREEAGLLKEEAGILREAAAAARTQDPGRRMKQAAGDIAHNRLGDAGKKEQESAQTLEKMVQSLDERREEELDRLVKKLRQTEKKMAELAEEQDRLQKKTREAAQMKDPAQRQETLRRLAREQEKLRSEAREITRELTRLRADRAREALSRAGGEMEDAGQQLERGQEAGDSQDEALDRLDEARRQVQKARADAEEELAREKLVKIADQLRRLKERHEALLPRTADIHHTLRKQRLDRVLQARLSSLANAQDDLGEETIGLAEGKLKDTLVFARLLKRSGESMRQAAKSMKDRVAHPVGGLAELDVKAAETADARTRGLQQEALHHLERLLEALKPEDGVSRQAKNSGNGPTPDGSKGESDGIPHLAQLKALKALQQDVNRRTEEFARKHPDAASLTKREQTELRAIEKDQADVADLLDQLTASEGDKP